MIIETSTANVLIAAAIAMQCWIIRELFKVKAKLTLILTHCKHCPSNTEYDTDRVPKA
jgi:hypothetical protein